MKAAFPRFLAGLRPILWGMTRQPPKELIAAGIPVKRDTPFFRGLSSCGKRGGKALYRDGSGKYYQWDSRHGEWESYDSRGYHIGVLNAAGTRKTKRAVRGRKIGI